MKTPDEIKKGLELHRGTLQCDGVCPYDGWNAETGSCIQRLMKDTVEYIQQLESRLAQVELERDALIRFIQKESFPAVISAIPEACQWCKNHDGNFTKEVCKFCGTHDVYGNFEWRGVCPENTKEGGHD